MSKEWVKERKAHNRAQPSPQRKQAIKNEGSGNQFTPQEVKDEWQNAQMSLHTMVNA